MIPGWTLFCSFYGSTYIKYDQNNNGRGHKQNEEKINYLEKEIIAELNSLKSLCDKEEKKEIISTSCEEACQKYAHCASYTEGVTKEDLKDAYDTCFEECKTWSEKTIICINKKPITAPIDCENLGYCALPEYGGGYKK